MVNARVGIESHHLPLKYSSLNFPISSRIPDRWTILWQFAHRTAKSLRGSYATFSPLIGANGRKWCASINPRPISPYLSSNVIPQIWQVKPWSFLTSFVRAGFRSIFLCIRNCVASSKCRLGGSSSSGSGPMDAISLANFNCS